MGNENRARRGAALELMEEMSCLRRDMPSPLFATLVVDGMAMGASGSDGDVG